MHKGTHLLQVLALVCTASISINTRMLQHRYTAPISINIRMYKGTQVLQVLAFVCTASTSINTRMHVHRYKVLAQV